MEETQWREDAYKKAFDGMIRYIEVHREAELSTTATDWPGTGGAKWSKLAFQQGLQPWNRNLSNGEKN